MVRSQKAETRSPEDIWQNVEVNIHKSEVLVATVIEFNLKTAFSVSTKFREKLTQKLEAKKPKAESRKKKHENHNSEAKNQKLENRSQKTASRFTKQKADDKS